MQASDFALVTAWRARPHVLEWWDAIEPGEDLADYLIDPFVKPFIVHLDARPIAYIQVCSDAHAPGDAYNLRPAGLGDAAGVVGIDQFIGEGDLLGQGIGSAFVAAFAQLAWRIREVTHAVTDPSPRNARAIRAYEKAGFRDTGVTTKNGDVLMVMQRP